MDAGYGHAGVEFLYLALFFGFIKRPDHCGWG